MKIEVNSDCDECGKASPTLVSLGADLERLNEEWFEHNADHTPFNDVHVCGDCLRAAIKKLDSY